MSTHAVTHAESHDHGHHEEHLAHQFENRAQQDETYVVGMWAFLVTEIMFFGALFLIYTIYRASYPETFAVAHVALNKIAGSINTFVLLLSSLAMALAVHAAQVGKRKSVIGWLVVVNLCATGFMCIKAYEYYEKYEHHLFPGPTFSSDALMHGEHGASAAGESSGHEATVSTAEGDAAVGVNGVRADEGPGLPAGVSQDVLLQGVPRNQTSVQADRAQLFFSIYFAMTGLHAVHVLIGMIMMTVLILMLLKNRPETQYFMPIELVGLYWHFVDIVWIFLFPLLYLIGKHG